VRFKEMGFPGSDGKKSTCQCRRPRFNPWVWKIPWRKEWPPTPVFLPGEFHGHRSLAGYNPQGRKELDTTEQLTLRLFHFRLKDVLYNTGKYSHYFAIMVNGK